MNLNPLSDHLIVKPIKKESAIGGIILPDTGAEKPQTGEVMAVGPGKTLDNGAIVKIQIKVGDKILFKKYAPDEIKIDGEEFLVLSESEVIAIIN
jgi:chaperonin GroES